MKKVWKFLSYVLVAALASAATLAVSMTLDQPSAGMRKLEELQNLLNQRFIGETDETAMMDGAAEGMVASLNDRWSFYIPADEYGYYMEQMNNSYVGVGITIQQSEDDSGILVIQVTVGGPAEEAGVLAGDVLVAVNGESILGLTTNEVKERVVGDEGTFVTMTFLREGREVTFDVERRVVNTPVAMGEMLDGNIGLVTIVNFDARCAEETIAAMEGLLNQGAEKLIFDVRYNPGGYAHELVAVLDYILPEGELFRTVDYAGNEDADMSDEKCLTGIPMVVLVNGDSYSAAEFFAAALREYGYAIVVGEQTVGKGYFQRTYTLQDGSAVGLSVGKYFTPNGVSLAEVGGLTPDIEVPVTDEEAFGIYAGTLAPEVDPQIQAAVEALK